MSIFQQINSKEYIFETEYFFAIFDKYPVSPGHLLIISKELKTDFFSLNNLEKYDLINAVEIGKKIIDQSFFPSGYNIGMNCGEDAGQTVMHFHCHIIPRFNGDMKNPRGGIRHCVEGKGYYQE
jgi:diadenosine tetraphosphate (Ap4A) HIT family hydrolase